MELLLTQIIISFINSNKVRTVANFGLKPKCQSTQAAAERIIAEMPWQ